MEQKAPKKFFSSNRVVGLFAGLTLLLTIPIAVLFSQSNQDIRQRAAEVIPSPSVSSPPPVQGFGYIAGYVYLDQNQNGEREANEKPYVNAILKITQLKKTPSADDPGRVASVVSELRTDANGYFKFSFSNLSPDAVTYLVKLTLPDGYKTISTNPVVFTDVRKDARNLVQFGLIPLVKPVVTTAAVQQPTQQTIQVSPTPNVGSIQGQ